MFTQHGQRIFDCFPGERVEMRECSTDEALTLIKKNLPELVEKHLKKYGFASLEEDNNVAGSKGWWALKLKKGIVTCVGHSGLKWYFMRVRAEEVAALAEDERHARYFPELVTWCRENGVLSYDFSKGERGGPEHIKDVVKRVMPEECKACEEYSTHSMAPMHDGSPTCANGTSIAAGGTVAHCTCDNCF